MGIFDKIAGYFEGDSDPLELSSFVPQKTHTEPVTAKVKLPDSAEAKSVQIGKLICSTGENGEFVAQERFKENTGGATAVLRDGDVKYGIALPVHGVIPGAPLNFLQQQEFQTELVAATEKSGRRTRIYKHLFSARESGLEVDTPEAKMQVQKGINLLARCGFKNLPTPN